MHVICDTPDNIIIAGSQYHACNVATIDVDPIRSLCFLVLCSCVG